MNAIPKNVTDGNIISVRNVGIWICTLKIDAHQFVVTLSLNDSSSSVVSKSAPNGKKIKTNLQK